MAWCQTGFICIWKCVLQNGGHFVLASICQQQKILWKIISKFLAISVAVDGLAPSGSVTIRARLNIKMVFSGMAIFIIKIRRSWDRLIFIMGIPILVRRHLLYWDGRLVSGMHRKVSLSVFELSMWGKIMIPMWLPVLSTVHKCQQPVILMFTGGYQLLSPKFFKITYHHSRDSISVPVTFQIYWLLKFQGTTLW